MEEGIALYCQPGFPTKNEKEQPSGLPAMVYANLGPGLGGAGW